MIGSDGRIVGIGEASFLDGMTFQEYGKEIAERNLGHECVHAGLDTNLKIIARYDTKIEKIKERRI